MHTAAATPSWPTLRWIRPCTSSPRLSCPTRSSNRRMRHIVLRRPSASSQSRGATGLGGNRLELRGGRRVRAPVHLIERQRAQVLREHLDTPGLGVAHVAADLDVAADVELALAGQLAAVDHLVERVLHVLVLAVRELDPAEPVER